MEISKWYSPELNSSIVSEDPFFINLIPSRLIISRFSKWPIKSSSLTLKEGSNKSIIKLFDEDDRSHRFRPAILEGKDILGFSFD
jgi:hypothetical protein